MEAPLQSLLSLNSVLLAQIRNGEDKTASEVCEEPEAKAELQKWEAALGLRYSETHINST